MPGKPAGSRRAVRPPSPSVRAPDAASARSGPPTILPHLTVAIGASAGGLRAFTEFLDNLPPETGMAFVLIQHLDPVHKSLLVGLLAPHTTMQVVEAADGMPVVPNTVFVIPPDATMTISNGRLAVSSPAPARGNRWPVDSFFTSLAEDQNHHAVCIVLSGTGSDGTRSLPAVRQHGGYILVQADDDEQAMTGMPHSAVATGLVDGLLPVSAMPAMLIDHQRTQRGEASVADVTGAPGIHPTQFAEICALLRRRTGHDFSQYKQATLMRRIRRRMQALRIATAHELLLRLRNEPELIDTLFHELLIGVTQFLRDRAAFLAVQQTVLPQILAGKASDQQVRLWVPGCASGEEVYTLAILLKELTDRQQTPPKVQIFGTDIDEAAIATARAACYRGPALAGLTPEQRDRWFAADGDACRAVPAIREMCVFSLHSVIKDPPFSKLDMISCRNLLIYLGSELQSQVIRSFHYALNPGGWLLLGPSEGVARGGELFAPTDKRHRIFQRQAAMAAAPTLAPRGLTPTGLVHPANGPYQPASLDDALDRSARRALERYAPAYVVIDRACNIVRFSGGAVGRFLEPSPGIANLNLLGILHRSLRPAVRSAVEKAIADRSTVVEENLAFALEGHSHRITLIAQPISDGRAGRDCYLVAFHDAGLMRGRPARGTGPADAAPDDDRLLAQELAGTRSQLMAAIGDLETANEELRSFNEEYQSTNEELQATNEELETAKEEMQSVNEELLTVNTELTVKNEQLTRLNDDFQNLLESTEIATIFLDHDLQIMRFTPGMTELLHLRVSDLGRPITEITGPLAYPDLSADVASVLDSQQTVEREVQLADDGASFLMRMRPYHTADKAVDGVVLTFVDISEAKQMQAEKALRTHNQTLERRVAERTEELEIALRALTLQTERRQRVEEMLRQSQKLEALGKLTGGIAHDFNNLLGVIIGNVEFLMSVVRDDEINAGLAREILDSALSGAELTRRLLAFASKQPLQPRAIELNALLSSHVTLLSRTLGEAIRVTARLAPDLWLTQADPSQVGDALLNLALNARDAMPHGGNLTIETANMHLPAPDPAEHTQMIEGDYVVLAVTDSGIGMSPDVVERATEPFFTTKPPAIGSGLGLSMIYGFAIQSGGHLTIDSEVGVGTTVRLYLPRALDAAGEVPDVAGAEVLDPRGDESILLVDDNLMLLAATQRHLNGLGYQVETAGSGPAALAILRTGRTFDLLFTDVVMPEGMSGYDLAKAAQHLQPGLKVLFTTGYAAQPSAGDDGAHDTRELLYKPYQRSNLARAVRVVLDGGNTAP
jgi:two-component system, chemotaxis family, CheB/CheR fusion protein